MVVGRPVQVHSKCPTAGTKILFVDGMIFWIVFILNFFFMNCTYDSNTEMITTTFKKHP